MAEATGGPASSDDIKRRVAEFYDAHAEHFLSWAGSSDANKLHYLDQVLPRLRKREGPVSVLELGCGAGVPCTQILAAEKNVDLTAVDISEAQLELARQKLPEAVKLVHADMMALQFSEGTFDAVVAFYSIMHLPRDEQAELIRRIAAWLKPGGVLLATLNASAMDGADEHWLGREKGWMYWSSYDREGSVRAVSDAGFRPILDEVKDTEEEVVTDGEAKVIKHPHLWILAEVTG